MNPRDGRHGDEGPPTPTWEAIERILDAALALEPREWASLLDAECAGDEALRAEVETLLRQHSRIDGFLEEPAARLGGASDADGEAGTTLVGERLGAYRILREIGRGGMGRVFLAERADGEFDQRVAVKLLRAGWRSEGTVRRFRAERQILARLEHPSIARLIDGGVTRDGRPYLITEYVEGVPVVRHCDELRLSIRRRLELFLEIVAAVEHAHQNLVVHRDLKPSNILVTGDGRVKLLDFGIAKLLDPASEARPRDEGTPRGAYAHRWLTPEYAAPEQIFGRPATTATDVYQLGIVLYELLAGCRPFELRPHAPVWIERAVVETPPERPSVAAAAEPGPAASSGDADGEDVGGGGGGSQGPGVAERRATRPDRLRRALEGDLDAIVLKTLRKRPGDRYASARALSEDVERHLNVRPVFARRATPVYRTGKFARRHRWGVATAGLILVLVAAFAILASVQAGEVARERDRAEAALGEASDVMAALTDMFEAVDPRAGEIADPPAANALFEIGHARVRALEGRPRAQAGLLEVLAGVQAAHGRLDAAETDARRAISLRRRSSGSESPEVAGSLNALAEVLQHRGRYGEATALHREALALQIRTLGPDDPAVAETLTLLADRLSGGGLAESEELFERALEIRRATLPADDPRIVQSLIDVGRIATARGHAREAEASFLEALTLGRRVLGPEHPKVAATLIRLADISRRYHGDGARAESLYRQALAIQRRSLGEDHPDLTHAMGKLALLLSGSGEHGEAEALLRESLDLRRRVFGPEHRSVAEGLAALAGELRRQGRLAEAERLRRQEVEIWEKAVGTRHFALAGALAGLGNVRADRGDFEEAKALYQRAIDIRSEARGERHFNVGLLLGSLAGLYARQEQYAVAESLYHRALGIVLARRAPGHPSVRRLREGLSELYAVSGRPKDVAIRLLGERE